MARIISIVNHKGGVGKTTTSASLLAGLTALNKRVIAIDMDGQANLTSLMNIGEQEENIYTALKNGGKLPVYENENRLKIVPSTLDLQAAELELSVEPGRELLLKGLLAPYLSQLDYIIIDCAPSLGLLTLNALTASTDVIIPIEAEPLSLKGMGTILDIVEKVKSRLNEQLKIMGVLVTKFDKRKVINREVLKTVYAHYPGLVFSTLISDNVKLAETAAASTDIFSHDKNSKGAKDYMTLCHEIIEK